MRCHVVYMYQLVQVISYRSNTIAFNTFYRQYNYSGLETNSTQLGIRFTKAKKTVNETGMIMKEMANCSQYLSCTVYLIQVLQLMPTVLRGVTLQSLIFNLYFFHKLIHCTSSL